MSNDICTNPPVYTMETAPLPQVYYQPSAKTYWRADRDGNWIQVDKESAMNFLILSGFPSSAVARGMLSPAQIAMMRVQTEQNIKYAGPLAGYRAGFYTINGQRILATESPQLIEPVQGCWPILARLLEGMLVDGEIDQQPYFFGWLKQSIIALQEERWMAGQVLALAGPVRGGKSLLQTLITKLLGGREAHPFQFMIGHTTFNADLFVAEHLRVDDQAESIDIRSRRTFGAHIKQVAVTESHRCHPKNATALMLTPRRRMTISLNDDGERLLVLPPLDDDVKDKLMLFKVYQRPMPMPTRTTEEQAAFMRNLESELPAFVHYLLNYEIPVQLQEPRFGIATYHHPELVQLLSETAPEVRLLELIDSAIPEFYGEDSEALAAQWMQRLTNSLRYEAQARQLLQHVNACGNYLSRLEKQENSRVSSRLLDGRRYYSISRPINSESSGQVDQVLTLNGRSRVNNRQGAEQLGESSPLVHLNRSEDPVPRPPAGLELN
jgi:hypothetical protein